MFYSKINIIAKVFKFINMKTNNHNSNQNIRKWNQMSQYQRLSQ